MRFFERFERKEEGVKGLHENFGICDRFWCHNRDYSYTDGKITMKARFSFDDPSSLNECPFLAKIGLNKDPDVPGKYIGFAYGSDAQTLEAWAKKFSFSELITELDNNGVITKNPEKIANE